MLLGIIGCSIAELLLWRICFRLSGTFPLDRIVWTWFIASADPGPRCRRLRLVEWALKAPPSTFIAFVASPMLSKSPVFSAVSIGLFVYVLALALGWQKRTKVRRLCGEWGPGASEEVIELPVTQMDQARNDINNAIRAAMPFIAGTLIGIVFGM